MAIITLTANTNYSAIVGLVNGDTIRCGTFRLTVDVQPTHTNITVDSPGTAGRMTVNGAFDLSTWAIFAGTVALIDGTLPAGAHLGSVQGGTGSNSFGVNTNNGTITTATGGTGQASYGVSTNDGSIVNANGGAGFLTISHGVNINNSTITNATGGSGRSANGVGTNNGTVIKATGGTASPDAYGIGLNRATCLQAFNAASRAINVSRGDAKLVDGPNFRTTIDQTNNTIATIYTFNGPLHASAVVPAGTTVIELGAGGSTSRPANPFRQQVIR